MESSSSHLPEPFNQRIDALIKNTSNHQGGKKALLGLSLLAVVLMVTGVVFASRLAQAPKETQDSRANTGTPSVAPLTTEEPWGYADESITPPPQIPSLTALDQLFRQTRQSMIDRSYEQFKLLASAQRIWSIENPNAPFDTTAEGLLITKLTEPAGKINFSNSVIPGIIYDAPQLSDIVATTATKRETYVSAPALILIDEKANISKKIILTPWKYIVDLSYQLKNGLVDTGSGTVTFVYDTNKWVYQGEYWKINHHKTSLNKGDISNTPQKTVDMLTPDTFPQKITVSVGGAVKWTNVTGLIYSVEPASIHWNSDYLSNDSYTKQFTTKGTYPYQLQTYINNQSNVYESTIEVL